jgi:D-arabinose 1-dehydrogenase-like Zn-dependent alcohol dehydrogenase
VSVFPGWAAWTVIAGIAGIAGMAAKNLCDHPTFTGYAVNGGFAEYALARTDFVFPLPADLADVQVAPLLCAGIMGFRSLRVCRRWTGRAGRALWVWQFA